MIKIIFQHFLIISIISLVSCSSKQTCELEIINQFEDCEEVNIHYRIVELSDKNLKTKVNSIVLPELSKGINNANTNALLWPAFSKKRILLKVNGYFKKSDFSYRYGCIGSEVLVITELISIEDVSEHMNFQVKE